MKLFKVEVRFKRKRRGRYGLEAIVHARSRAAAERFIAGKYTGCTIERTIPLDGARPKHFVIADWLVDI